MLPTLFERAATSQAQLDCRSLFGAFVWPTLLTLCVQVLLAVHLNFHVYASLSVRDRRQQESSVHWQRSLGAPPRALVHVPALVALMPFPTLSRTSCVRRAVLSQHSLSALDRVHARHALDPHACHSCHRVCSFRVSPTRDASSLQCRSVHRSPSAFQFPLHFQVTQVSFLSFSSSLMRAELHRRMDRPLLACLPLHPLPLRHHKDPRRHERPRPPCAPRAHVPRPGHGSAARLSLQACDECAPALGHHQRLDRVPLVLDSWNRVSNGVLGALFPWPLCSHRGHLFAPAYHKAWRHGASHLDARVGGSPCAHAPPSRLPHDLVASLL
mmetsp:Transcript_60483/g.160815  ORF Transcript_60483/g.160815 Transcript_60483/m.160815 type:complete len:327 (-) Transcript_60483:19-999(-)